MRTIVNHTELHGDAQGSGADTSRHTLFVRHDRTAALSSLRPARKRSVRRIAESCARPLGRPAVLIGNGELARAISLVVLLVFLVVAGFGAAAALSASSEARAARSCSETCAPQLTPVPGGQPRLAVTHRRRRPDVGAVARGRRSNDDAR
jgi:hypothetical protein